MLLQQTNGQNNTECNGLINDNAGCAIIEWSRASYGPYFDSQGGGVFAMKWDDSGIAVCARYPSFASYSTTQPEQGLSIDKQYRRI